MITRTFVVTTVLAMGLAGCAGLPVQTSGSPVEWPAGVRIPQSEKREILELAKVMGVAEPVKVSIGVVAILGDRFVTVDGRLSFDGPHRRWSRAEMFRENWRGPDDAPPPELRKHRVGRWISMGDAEQISLWRIEDGAWFVDVRPRGEVSFADTQRIVLALRRTTYVSGTSDATSEGRVLASLVTAKEIQISKDPGEAFSLGWPTGEYSGCVVEVALTDDAVKLVAAFTYVV